MSVERPPGVSRWYVERRPGTTRWDLAVAAMMLILTAAFVVLGFVNGSWLWATAAAVVAVAFVVGLWWQPKEVAFGVGEHEQHRVAFRLNKFWGNLAITVDGRAVIREFRMFSLSQARTYNLSVGADEQHEVRIETLRPLLFSFARPQLVRAYVDNMPAANGTV